MEMRKRIVVFVKFHRPGLGGGWTNEDIESMADLHNVLARFKRDNSYIKHRVIKLD